jgi:hypothetical protein
MTRRAPSGDRFVADSYVPRGSGPSVDQLVLDVRHATAASEERVRLIRCIELPDDELCTWTFEADSEASVRAIGSAADLELERVTRAVERWPAPRPRS